MDLPSDLSAPQCVVLHNKLYVYGGSLKSSGKINYIFISSIDLSSWTEEDTPVGMYGLTTYKSQIILVGGKKGNRSRIARETTNEVWSSPDGVKWSHTLPAMSMKRDCPLAVNPGSPECLIVVGGEQQDAPSLIEVLIEEQWFHVESSPVLSRSSRPSSTFHMGNLYVRCDTMSQKPSFLYCNVHSLMKTATSTSRVKETITWNEFHIPQVRAIPVSFQNELLAVGGIPHASAMYAFSADTQTWVQVGVTPMGMWSSGVVVLSTGEMVAMSGASDASPGLCKAKLKGDKITILRVDFKCV